MTRAPLSVSPEKKILYVTVCRIGQRRRPAKEGEEGAGGGEGITTRISIIFGKSLLSNIFGCGGLTVTVHLFVHPRRAHCNSSRKLWARQEGGHISRTV